MWLRKKKPEQREFKNVLDAMHTVNLANLSADVHDIKRLLEAQSGTHQPTAHQEADRSPYPMIGGYVAYETFNDYHRSSGEAILPAELVPEFLELMDRADRIIGQTPLYGGGKCNE